MLKCKSCKNAMQLIRVTIMRNTISLNERVNDTPPTYAIKFADNLRGETEETYELECPVCGYRARKLEEGIEVLELEEIAVIPEVDITTQDGYRPIGFIPRSDVVKRRDTFCQRCGAFPVYCACKDGFLPKEKPDLEDDEPENLFQLIRAERD